MAKRTPHALPLSHRPAALYFILATVVLDVLSLGLCIPVLAPLIAQLHGGDTASAARLYGAFAAAWALMQFLFAPVLGALSDRYGRRPVILLSCLGLGLDYLLMALAPSLLWLFIGRLLSGITAANHVCASAYIADVTPATQRAAAFGMLGAAWGVGFVIGPALGGLLGSVDVRLPFWVAAVLSLLNTLYGAFVLPESHPPERRTAFVWAKANPVGALRLLRAHPQLLRLSGVNALSALTHFVLPSCYVLYVGHRYGWDVQTVGLSLTAVGVLNILVQGVLVKPAIARLGERGCLYLALAAGAFAFAGFGLAADGRVFAALLLPLSLMGLFSPSYQALSTRRVSAQQQGQLQGANGSVTGMAGIVGPGLFTQVMALFMATDAPLPLPGAPFLLAALLLLLALVLARRERPEASPTTE